MTQEKFIKVPQKLLRAEFLHWIANGVEHTAKIGIKEKMVYCWLLNEFTYLNHKHNVITFSNKHISQQTGFSVSSVKRVKEVLTKALLLDLAPLQHQNPKQFAPQRYLHVIDIISSNKHRLSYEGDKKPHKDKWDYKQIKQYQDNKAFIQATEGRYMTSQEKEKAHLEPLKSGVAFKLIDSV